MTTDVEYALDPVQEVGPVDAVVAANRARIAELRAQRVGGAPDLGDIL